MRSSVICACAVALALLCLDSARAAGNQRDATAPFIAIEQDGKAVASVTPVAERFRHDRLAPHRR